MDLSGYTPSLQGSSCFLCCCPESHQIPFAMHSIASLKPVVATRARLSTATPVVASLHTYTFQNRLQCLGAFRGLSVWPVLPAHQTQKVCTTTRVWFCNEHCNSEPYLQLQQCMAIQVCLASSDLLHIHLTLAGTPFNIMYEYNLFKQDI